MFSLYFANTSTFRKSIATCASLPQVCLLTYTSLFRLCALSPSSPCFFSRFPLHITQFLQEPNLWTPADMAKSLVVLSPEEPWTPLQMWGAEIFILSYLVFPFCPFFFLAFILKFKIYRKVGRIVQGNPIQLLLSIFNILLHLLYLFISSPTYSIFSELLRVGCIHSAPILLNGARMFPRSKVTLAHLSAVITVGPFPFAAVHSIVSTVRGVSLEQSSCLRCRSA